MARFYDEGGLDTARVSAAAEDAEHRARERRRARTGVAAMVADAYGGVEALASEPLLRDQAAGEFRELLDMLDLDATPRPAPGLCAREGCGQARPILSASSGGAGGARKWMRLGFCSAGCWAAS